VKRRTRFSPHLPVGQMPHTDRLNLIKQIEETRGSQVICYLTSVRPNVSAQMSDDAVRVFFDHLLLLPTRPVEKLDIYLCSNGGPVPYRGGLCRYFVNTPRASAS
jgi:hypothetical protein